MSLNWYRLKAYLRYRREARGRHGVHSPFVFDFIEKGLRSNPSRTLQQKIRDYFSGSLLVECPAEASDQWMTDALSKATPDTIILLNGIHRSAHHTSKWETLRQHPSVRLSIDLFDLGLLFFRDAFKEKQHFILKK